jgi:protein-disulfide isomerase
MTGVGTRLALGAAWIALAMGLLAAAGCTASIPDLPSMPSFGALEAEPQAAAEAEKPKAEQAPVNIAELNQPGPLGDQAIGKANAPVTIVQYVSLTCPICSRFQAEVMPKLKKAYIDKGKVRLVVREFPIGHSAATAAIVSRCVSSKDYFKVVDKFLANQKDWVALDVKKDEIYNVVKFTGLKRDKFDSCLDTTAINDALFVVKQRGRALGVAGTPTFFVNGKKIAGAHSFEDMQAVIEAALAAPQTPPAPVPQSEAGQSPRSRG